MTMANTLVLFLSIITLRFSIPYIIKNTSQKYVMITTYQNLCKKTHIMGVKKGKFAV